MEVWASYDPH